MPRKERKRTAPPEAFLHPIDVKDFGDFEKDPCFGKLYSLSEDACQICGDIELCSIVFAENMKKKRLLAEAETKTKDLELHELDYKFQAKKFFDALIDGGKVSRVRALKKTSTRFRFPIREVRQIVQNGYGK